MRYKYNNYQILDDPKYFFSNKIVLIDEINLYKIFQIFSS